MTDHRHHRGFWALPTADRRALRRFGQIMAGAMLLLGLWLGYKSRTGAAEGLAAAAALFLFLSLALPGALRVVFVPWTYLGRCLGWLNSRLLLALVFYTLFTVTGLALRLWRRDPLDRRREPGRDSYFARRDPALLPREHYERQF